MGTKVKPLADNILVEREPEEMMTAGGLHIPDMASERPNRGKILAVGSGHRTDKGTIPLDVKPGDRIMFGKYAGHEIEFEGVQYLMMREEDVIAIME